MSAFTHWFKLVNGEVEARIGLSVHDIADQPYRDWFDDGVEPHEAADMAVEEVIQWT